MKAKTFLSLGPVSGHASGVASNFYGAASFAPGITEIKSYDIAWAIAREGLLRPSTGLPPGFSLSRVANHSWIHGHADASSREMLERFDFVVAVDDFIQVGGTNNGERVPDVTVGAYNVIVVGRTDGKHARRTTAVGQALYGAGRARPDIVAPASFTSTSTPRVASAAAMLVGFARQGGRHDPRRLLRLPPHPHHDLARGDLGGHPGRAHGRRRPPHRQLDRRPAQGHHRLRPGFCHPHRQRTGPALRRRAAQRPRQLPHPGRRRADRRGAPARLRLLPRLRRRRRHAAPQRLHLHRPRRHLAPARLSTSGTSASARTRRSGQARRPSTTSTSPSTTSPPAIRNRRPLPPASWTTPRTSGRRSPLATSTGSASTAADGQEDFRWDFAVACGA